MSKLSGILRLIIKGEILKNLSRVVYLSSKCIDFWNYGVTRT